MKEGDIYGLIDRLDDDQRVGFEQMVEFAMHPPRGKATFFAQGPAGAGKTYLLSTVAYFLDLEAITAPTGKAASILKRKTGLRAQTVHGFLYQYRGKKKTDRGREEIIWDQLHAPGSLSDRIVLLDEAGMASDELVRDLLTTGLHIIACGDLSQLKPVGRPAYFTEPDFELTRIHRQARGNPIIEMAHAVRNGGSYESAGDRFRVVDSVYDSDIATADIMLCHTHRKRMSLNGQARALKGIWSRSPQPGEPLLCRRNFARGGLFRGGIYQLVSPFEAGDTDITIDVDGVTKTIANVAFLGLENGLSDDDLNTSFELGYACTVHSAAGSEWDNVLFFDDLRTVDPDERRRFQYTGITRAAQRITVVRS